MPLYLFKNRNFVALTLISAVGAMIFYASNIVYPQQIVVIWQKSASQAGWYAVCASHLIKKRILSNNNDSALWLAEPF